MLREIGRLVDNAHTAQAAVEVLEAAGSQVLVPEPSLCCGRPLYDWGMLDLGARTLHQTLDALAPLIQAGVPLVGRGRAVWPSSVTHSALSAASTMTSR